MQITNNKLVADPGMRLTDGETVATVVHLASGAAPANWREVTEAEAEIIRTNQMEADAASYESALAEMGVSV